MPGSDLSHPAMATRASKRSACITSSTESAITSRDTSEARMPSWPIEIPSLTAMVVNTRPTPLAAATPALACSESSGPVRLQGVTSLPAETTPTWGFAKSSPVRPTARSIALAPALAAPSVTSWERSLLLMRHDPKTAVWQLRPNGTQSSNGDDLLRQRHRPRSHPWPEGGDHRLRQPGACHALNLEESGVDVVVGLREGSSSRQDAQGAGLRVLSPAEAAEWADVIMMLVPDQVAADIYAESIEPHLAKGDALLLPHGLHTHCGL